MVNGQWQKELGAGEIAKLTFEICEMRTNRPNQKPFTIYHLPFTIYTYHLPLTTYHLPFTIHHLPFTVYRLPFTVYHLTNK